MGAEFQDPVHLPPRNLHTIPTANGCRAKLYCSNPSMPFPLHRSSFWQLCNQCEHGGIVAKGLLRILYPTSSILSQRDRDLQHQHPLRFTVVIPGNPLDPHIYAKGWVNSELTHQVERLEEKCRTHGSDSSPDLVSP
ncbi:hypothetical protein AHAS_Ahas20G0156100 [Arachis hypogaea]